MYLLLSRPMAKMTTGRVAGESASFQSWPGGCYVLKLCLIVTEQSLTNNIISRNHGMYRQVIREDSADRRQGMLREPLVNCFFLCRPDSVVEDDTSSELQRLAEMDASQQGRGGFRRWVPPWPWCYPLLPTGTVKLNSVAFFLSVPLDLPSETFGKHCQCYSTSALSSWVCSFEQSWSGQRRILFRLVCLSVKRERFFPQRGLHRGPWDLKPRAVGFIGKSESLE